MKTHNLTARRSTIADRFRSYRLAALAASAVVSPTETMLRPIAPRVPSVWVAKRAPLDPLDVPLPADFVPAPVEPFVSAILPLDAETEAQIARESAAEIAETFARMERETEERHAARFARWAVRFVSDYGAAPVDYSPDGTHGKVAAVRAPRFPALAASMLTASGNA